MDQRGRRPQCREYLTFYRAWYASLVVRHVAAAITEVPPGQFDVEQLSIIISPWYSPDGYFTLREHGKYISTVSDFIWQKAWIGKRCVSSCAPHILPISLWYCTTVESRYQYTRFQWGHESNTYISDSIKPFSLGELIYRM